MNEERPGQANEGQNRKKIRLPRQPAVFLGILLAEGAVTLGLLLCLAYLSFRLRFSTELIRAWLVLLYIAPCLLGGRMVRWVKLQPPLPWAFGAGAAFYGGLALLSSLQGLATPGTDLLLLCISSAVMGIFIGKKHRTDKKSDGNE